MRAERREARLDRLLVAHVGEDVVEARDARLGTDRRGHARLSERRDQPQGFEQYGLAAGVRAGHEEGPFVRGHREVERDHVHALGEQERMAPVVDLESVSRVDEARRRALVGVGETRAREKAVQLDEGGECRDHRVAVRAQRVGEREKDAIDLGHLLVFQLADPISELHRRRRFDEERSARRGRVVHDAARRHLTAAPHGDHVPPVAHRHRGVGHAMMRLEALHLAFENANERAVGGAKLAPQVPQRRRRVVLHDAVVLERLVDRRFRRWV